jgi:hypothetical protein
MADAVRFIKISKKDKNGIDKTSTLQSLSELTIPYSTGNVRYKILNITEKPTYFLYEVNNPNLEWADSAKIEYDFLSSIQLQSDGTSYTISGVTTVELYKTDISLNQSIPLINTVTDNLGFYVPTSSNGFLTHTAPGLKPDGAYYQINTYPQKSTEIHFSGSFLTDVIYGASPQSHALYLIVKRQNDTNLIPYIDLGINSTRALFTLSSPTTSFTSSFHLSMSYGENSSSDVEALPGDKVFAYISFNPTGGETTGSFSSDTFFSITSSVSSGLALESIPEPYFSENFSRALDCQPLLNNAVNNRLSNFHQDIDYSSGLLTPTNFELLISGSALKASIQDSNYTLKRHTNPRYEGSRTTSQKLNEWTEGDTNTYGKLPTTLTQDRVIYEFEFGGGTTPEILGWGGLKNE